MANVQDCGPVRAHRASSFPACRGRSFKVAHRLSDAWSLGHEVRQEFWTCVFGSACVSSSCTKAAFNVTMGAATTFVVDGATMASTWPSQQLTFSPLTSSRALSWWGRAGGSARPPKGVSAPVSSSGGSPVDLPYRFSATTSSLNSTTIRSAGRRRFCFDAGINCRCVQS
jgi:hypothetical protein